MILWRLRNDHKNSKGMYDARNDRRSGQSRALTQIPALIHAILDLRVSIAPGSSVMMPLIPACQRAAATWGSLIVHT